MHTKEPYHHGDLYNALINCALLLLEEKGFDQFSLRDIAKLAGVSHNAPYRHFKNKKVLLSALAEHGFLNLHTTLQHAVTQAGNVATEQLIAAGVAYTHQAINNPQMFRLMFAGQLDFERCPASLKQAADQAYQTLENSIKKGINDQCYRSVDSDILTTTAWSTMHGLAMLFIAGHFAFMSKQQLDDMIHHVAETVVYGITNTNTNNQFKIHQ